jgi:hypothetical protein
VEGDGTVGVRLRHGELEAVKDGLGRACEGSIVAIGGVRGKHLVNAGTVDEVIESPQSLRVQETKRLPLQSTRANFGHEGMISPYNK